jgi:hypothetical protein
MDHHQHPLPGLPVQLGRASTTMSVDISWRPSTSVDSSWPRRPRYTSCRTTRAPRRKQVCCAACTSKLPARARQARARGARQRARCVCGHPPGAPPTASMYKVVLDGECQGPCSGYRQASRTASSRWRKDTVFNYKCTALLPPAAERTIRWNDPDLAIDWGIAAPIVSAKDRRRFAVPITGTMAIQELAAEPCTAPHNSS